MAGTQSPSFFVDGENMPGKVNTIHKNPMMQITLNITGLFLIYSSFWLFISCLN